RWFVRVDGRIALAEVEAERAFRLTRRLVILGRLVVFAAEQPRYNSVEHRPLVGGRVFRPRVVKAVGGSPGRRRTGDQVTALVHDVDCCPVGVVSNGSDPGRRVRKLVTTPAAVLRHRRREYLDVTGSKAVINDALGNKLPLVRRVRVVADGESERRPGRSFTHHRRDGNPGALVDLAAGARLRENNEIIGGSALRRVIVYPGVDIMT